MHSHSILFFFYLQSTRITSFGCLNRNLSFKFTKRRHVGLDSPVLNNRPTCTHNGPKFEAVSDDKNPFRCVVQLFICTGSPWLSVKKVLEWNYSRKTKCTSTQRMQLYRPGWSAFCMNWKAHHITWSIRSFVISTLDWLLGFLFSCSKRLLERKQPHYLVIIVVSNWEFLKFLAHKDVLFFCPLKMLFKPNSFIPVGEDR